MSLEHLSIPEDIAAVNDYLPHAKRKLSNETWEYIHSGSADDHSFAKNESRFSNIQLNSRVLRDVSHGSTRTTILNQELAHPIALGPVAYQKLAHADGELASAAAAEAQDALFVLSTLASTSLEAVATTTSGPKWFQLYFVPSREETLSLVRRAEHAGYSAIVVTVDAPVNGLRNRLHRAGFDLPADIRAVNIQGVQTAAGELQPGQSRIFDQLMAISPTWDDMRWLREHTQLPLLLKGISHPDDARMARDIGADGIVVSNHGGRILDTVPASIDLLPAVARAVGADMTVLFDGGIRRGSDIFKALALGADGVMLGRPIMYALATAGALGVAHILRVLRDELELTMALCGCRSIQEIDRSCLWQQST